MGGSCYNRSVSEEGPKAADSDDSVAIVSGRSTCIDLSSALGGASSPITQSSTSPNIDSTDADSKGMQQNELSLVDAVRNALATMVASGEFNNDTDRDMEELLNDSLFQATSAWLTRQLSEFQPNIEAVEERWKCESVKHQPRGNSNNLLVFAHSCGIQTEDFDSGTMDRSFNQQSAMLMMFPGDWPNAGTGSDGSSGYTTVHGRQLGIVL